MFLDKGTEQLSDVIACIQMWKTASAGTETLDQLRFGKEIERAVRLMDEDDPAVGEKIQA